VQARYPRRSIAANQPCQGTRISKIAELIQQSKFSVHDLSRIRSSEQGEVYRLNMAFELGMDYGCRVFGEGESKKFLILEKERYTYQKALSDLSGSDIKNHNNEPEAIVREVRDWFVQTTSSRLPSGTVIWLDFNEFMADFYQKRYEQGYRGRDLESMPTQEYVDFIKEWLENRD
jgi:hypothetical protein